MSAKSKTLEFVAEINADELALRLMQIVIGLRPRHGIDATTALNQAQANWPDASGGFPFRRMAAASIEYFRECIEKGQRPA